MEKIKDVQPSLKGVVISKSTFQKQALQQDLLTPGLWGLFLSGILVGACRSGDVSAVAESFLAVRQAGDWRTAFISAFISAAGMVLLLFVSGLCAVGQPGAAVILLIRGMGLGSCVAELYRQMGIEGAAAVFLLLILPEAIAAFCFLQGAKSALRMSTRIFAAILSPEPPVLLPYLKRYGVKLLMILGLLLLAAMLSGLCTGILGPALCCLRIV